MENKNRDGGNMQDTMVFNEVISNIGLQGIPLIGRSYTWSTMQQDPLLEQLDWCFTSSTWISICPNTLMLPLARTTSDNTPCMIQIGTSIPKAKVFRFENFWIDQLGFLDIVQAVWQSEFKSICSATKLSAKFKFLRRMLRRWAQNLSNLKKQIQVCNEVVLILDKLEENRRHFCAEKNFRNILKGHITKLLQFQKEYWRQRYTIRWTKLGDQSTKIFHAAATERYRINTITSIDTNDGRTLTAHADKASFIWEEYRSRLSCSNHTQMVFNIQELIQEQDLQNITTPFTKEDIDDVIKEMPSDKAPGPDGFSGTFIKKMLAYHQRRFLQPMF
jgi:hypothetical protein